MLVLPVSFRLLVKMGKMSPARDFPLSHIIVRHGTSSSPRQRPLPRAPPAAEAPPSRSGGAQTGPQGAHVSTGSTASRCPPTSLIDARVVTQEFPSSPAVTQWGSSSDVRAACCTAHQPCSICLAVKTELLAATASSTVHESPQLLNFPCFLEQ